DAGRYGRTPWVSSRTCCRRGVARNEDTHDSQTVDSLQRAAICGGRPTARRRIRGFALRAGRVRKGRGIVDRGFTSSYEYALQTLNEVPFGKGREYEPTDTVRFYALRLHEAGMSKSSPQKLNVQGTDWRF